MAVGNRYRKNHHEEYRGTNHESLTVLSHATSTGISERGINIGIQSIDSYVLLFSLPSTSLPEIANAIAEALILLYKQTSWCQLWISLQEDKLTAGHHEPERIHKYEIPPEVVRLWTIIALSKDRIFVQTSRIVNEIAIKLARRYQSLDWMAVCRVSCDQHSCQERQRAPGHLHRHQGS